MGEVKWDRDSTRYTVSKVQELRFFINDFERPNALVSLSYGGCGIYLTKKDDSLQPNEDPNDKKRVRIGFEFDGVLSDRITISGKLLYNREVPMDSDFVYYIGFQFLPAEKQKLNPIIEELERLNLGGDINTH